MLLQLSVELSLPQLSNHIAIIITITTTIITPCLIIPTMLKFIHIPIILKISFLFITHQQLLHLFQCMITITLCFFTTMVVSLMVFHQVKAVITGGLNGTLNHVMIFVRQQIYRMVSDCKLVIILTKNENIQQLMRII